MVDEIKMTEEEAEQIIKPIFDWLAGGAHGTNIDERYCFGTISQDLALGFAQELLESVGIDATPVMEIVHKLVSDDNFVIKRTNKTIH